MSKMSSSAPGTTSDDDAAAARVEADARSILEQALNANLIKVFPLFEQSGPTTNNKNDNNSTCNTNTSKITAADYDEIFGDDIDDSEELFEKILQEAEEAFKREMDLKKKNPFYKREQDIFNLPKQRNRKRKSKMVEESINIMNNFRRSLVEPIEMPQKTISTYVTTQNIGKCASKLLINNCYSAQKNNGMKSYPIWKTTKTYTPIFPKPSNPNWSSKKSSTISSKMYTPRHIHNWLDNATNTDFTGPSSCKSFRSDAATCASIDKFDNGESIASPIKTDPLNSSTPKRSTVVRFRPSPPKLIPWNSDGNSSISSNFLMEEENKQNENNEGDPKTDDFHFENYEISDESYEKYQENYQDYYEDDEQYLEENQEISKSKEYEEEFNFTNRNNTSTETNENISNNSKQPFFFEDFVRKLNYNVSNNYKMEVKCSMKLKYFK